MNTASVGLSAFDLAGLTAVAGSLIADADTATAVSFVSNTGGRAYDPGSGTSTYAETRTSVSAYLSPLSLEQVAKIDGAQVGDVQLLVRYADLTTAPETDDRFSAASVDYRIYRVVRGPFLTHYQIFAHRIA